MKKTKINFIVVILFLYACDGLPINGKDADSIRLISEDKAHLKNDSAAATKAWEAFKTPGDMHKMLAKANGPWKEAITMWDSPSATPQKANAACTNTMILNGLFQESTHKGNMMGMPFEGLSTVGYDNGRKEFFLNWIDNMGTGFMQLNGAYDSTTKTIHYKGTMTDATTGRPTDVREDFKFLSNDAQLLELYYSQFPGKPEFKTMEIKFTRK